MGLNFLSEKESGRIVVHGLSSFATRVVVTEQGSRAPSSVLYSTRFRGVAKGRIAA
jgi:hypothetical protein